MRGTVKHAEIIRKVTSIDISKIVIKQMNEKNKEQRPDLTYECMDATEMTYQSEKFSVVLDKGTFDALMPDSDVETLDRIDKYLNEISRVLKRGGRYVCITLLQEHILRKLVAYFPSHEFMLRVSRCYEAEAKTREDEGSAFPVFVVIATKFPGLPRPVLELALTDDKTVRVTDPDDIINGILGAQQSALVCNTLNKRSVSDLGEVSLDLCRPGDDQPRFTIHILDRRDIKVAKSYAAFIVPQGRDTDWIFGSSEGRQELLQNVSKDRLAVVILRREHSFESMEKVKQELGPSIKNFAPSGLAANYVIDFLSLGADVGHREIRCKGESKLSGPYVVEDVLGDEGPNLRRLIFLNNQFIVQSEARLKLVKNRHRDKKHGSSSSQSWVHGRRKFTVDHGFLACEHHPYMCVGATAAINVDATSEILVVGLGGGSLCTFLHQCFPKVKITAVDIDEEVLRIATSWFDLKLDERMKVEITDGIEFVTKASKEGKKFDAILLDVDSKDTTMGMSCPPKSFLETQFLQASSNCLNENGYFVLNLVCRDKSLRPSIVNDLETSFGSIMTFKLENHLNEIFVCSRIQRKAVDFKSLMVRALETLNNQSKTKKLSSHELIDVSSLLETLNVR
ncbi:eEF1A lysine and N-terminal methyltransferase homolog isoform X2 [Venturia canescens]|uniref:eEF1A lysine and N-terminal methyltransferase homolog isoform X2 n=1 Tax=Venturia canescens TaxID=32260 RepID=UPI001C9C1BFC|nr:eEF1A lysine and N-terminal methyltransferase homolog isoform X2 [Venturia canescens]